jgi:hypothetical protein
MTGSYYKIKAASTTIPVYHYGITSPDLPRKDGHFHTTRSTRAVQTNQKRCTIFGEGRVGLIWDHFLLLQDAPSHTLWRKSCRAPSLI